MDEIDHIRAAVRKEIKMKFGQVIFSAKDCQILAGSILKNTKRQLSVSTLKRFFGIIHSPFKPSKYTLDTLAIYLNYHSWEDFLSISKNISSSPTDVEKWIKLKSLAALITDQSLLSIKRKIGDQVSVFPARNFAVQNFEAFLQSPATATAFIAPGGYGKSTIVYQLTEMFFTGEDAKYPNDIVCLVDGSILMNMIDLDLELLQVKNLINFELNNSFSVFFRENPEQVKGRFVLIVESLYEIFYMEEKLNQFIKNLMDIINAYKNISWFKLLVTCRPDNWQVFLNLINKNPQLKSQWFNVSFEGELKNAINIPLLDNKEIKSYLKKYTVKNYQKLKYYYPEITEIISNPYLLKLFNV